MYDSGPYGDGPEPSEIEELAHNLGVILDAERRTPRFNEADHAEMDSIFKALAADSLIPAAYHKYITGFGTANDVCMVIVNAIIMQLGVLRCFKNDPLEFLQIRIQEIWSELRFQENQR